VPSVTSKMLEGDVAYIRVYTFGETTTSELRKALDTLLAEKPVGLILDLRNNGGGYLQTGIEVASEFIDKGVIVIEESGDGTRENYEALPGGKAIDIPMVVLVNKYSASASEIVAGAIQDHLRGKLVGETTFGKGSVQSWIPLVDDQGAVRITIARWLTPNGRLIHKVGLTPDVEVALTAEDTQAGKDPQLDKAVELLTGQ
jgi:carboxyl-terminal processing protease